MALRITDFVEVARIPWHIRMQLSLDHRSRSSCSALHEGIEKRRRGEQKTTCPISPSITYYTYYVLPFELISGVEDEGKATAGASAFGSISGG